MTILGIETSCDETAAAVLRVEGRRVSVISHVIASQALTHAKYGGVVPEVAAREHVTSIIPTIDRALKLAGVQPQAIDRIAVTAGPGLLTSLLVGVETAKALALAWGVPLVRVNHIEGHVVSGLLPQRGQRDAKLAIKTPAVALIVSGGHTELIRIPKLGCYQLLGKTRDDAAGEAFDKVAKLFGLPYPGGPAVSAAATGNPAAVTFPRPLIHDHSLDFSFSGLKTSVLYHLKGRRPSARQLPDLAASFEQAIVDVLVAKTLRAVKATRAKTLLLGGGVAANARLRTQLGRAVTTLPNLTFRQPNLAYATDNAAMVALAGALHAKADALTSVRADATWELVS